MDFYQSVTEAAVLVPFVTAALLHVAIAAIITYQVPLVRSYGRNLFDFRSMSRAF